jgi:CDP-paratose 2-epimerase
MKVLIAGGCGFIGSNLSLFLKKNNYEVFSIDNLYRNGSILNEKKLKENQIKNLRLDIKNLSKKKISKFDIIIDCCAEPSVEASKTALDRVINTNLIGTYQLLKKCIKDNSHFIFMSTSRVYCINEVKNIIKKNNLNKKIICKKTIDIKFSTAAPRSIYGYTKLASEELIKEFSYLFNVKYVINRLGVVAGPGQMGKEDQGFVSLWMWKHLNKLPLKYIGFGGHGNQMRDILHVNDVNRLILIQIKRFKKLNNITIAAGGGVKNLISLKDLTLICQKITGNKIPFSKIKKTSLYDIPYFCTSNTLAYKFYKWKPKLNIFDIIHDTFEWQKNNFKILKKYLN